MSQIIVKERPILMIGPNIQPILEGRKTQTRRIIRNQPIPNHRGKFKFTQFSDDEGIESYWANEPLWWTRCPYGQPGDRLWVRETWFHQEGGPIYDAAGGVMDSFDDEIIYRADKPNRKTVKWKPSIFMPRWASRILLEITEIRIERLQDISEADAKAEGASPAAEEPFRDACGELVVPAGRYRNGYRDLWESINGPGSWSLNPFVWVIIFKRIEG